MSVISVHSPMDDSAAAINDLSGQIVASQCDPSLIVLFCGPYLDGEATACGVMGRVPGARVLCCTPREDPIPEGADTGVTGVVFPRALAAAAVTALVSVDADLHQSVASASASLAEQLGAPLAELDPTRFVGLCLGGGPSIMAKDVTDLLGGELSIPFVVYFASHALNWAEAAITRRQVSLAAGIALAIIDLTTPTTGTAVEELDALLCDALNYPPAEHISTSVC